MLKLRKEHLEAFRPVVRSQVPHRILADLHQEGVRAERDPATGDIVATDGRGFQSRLSFYQDGLPARLSQPSGAAYAFQHNDHGCLSAVTYPGGERFEMGYDARANITELRRPGRSPYTLEHDEQDRLLAAHYPGRSTVRLTYHLEGPLESLTDRMGATTHWERDSSGQLQAVVDSLGRRTIYKTDTEGRLSTVVFPDGSHEEYTFDPVSRSGIVKTRGGSASRHRLDQNNRLQSIEWLDGAHLHLEYDCNGRILSVQNDVSDVAFDYDSQGHIQTETTQDGIVKYSYDSDGRLIRLVNQRGDAVEYSYDSDGRLSLVRDWEGHESFFGYSADCALTEIRYANGLVEKQEYSSLGRIRRASITNRRGVKLSEQVYDYDQRERVKTILDTWGDLPQERTLLHLEYDAEDRITAEIDALSRRIVTGYAYDLQGNLIGDGDIAIEIGQLDQPLRFGAATIGYDEDGNIQSLPGPQGELHCAFSADGTLRSLRAGNNLLQFEYDSLGRRIRKRDGSADWHYGWAGDQLLWEECHLRDGSSVRRDYLFLPDEHTPFAFREEGEVYWFQRDVRGAVICAFDARGSVVWRSAYGSFGSAQVQISQVRQPWRLSGHYEDSETGLYYNFTRYYSPKLKTYLSRDASWRQAEATPYSYARQDPWNRIDPLGALPSFLKGIVSAPAHAGGAVASAVGADALIGIAGSSLVLKGRLIAGESKNSAMGLLGGLVEGIGGKLLASMVRTLLGGDLICVVCLARAALAKLLDRATGAISHLADTIASAFTKAAKAVVKWGRDKAKQLEDWFDEFRGQHFGENYSDGIKIKGSREFRQKTRAALDELKGTKTGKEILTQLDNGKGVVIVQTQGGNEAAAASNDAFPSKAQFNDKTGRIDIEKPGKGSSTTVKFNPDKNPKYPGTDKLCRPPSIGLGHELIHAVHNGQGRNLVYHDDDTDPMFTKEDPSNHEEAQTIGRGAYATDTLTDNALRREMGYKERTSHGSICP